MHHAALMLGVLLTASLPSDATAQRATTAFQDNYADVNGVRLHYASVGTGPLILFLHGYPSFWVMLEKSTQVAQDIRRFVDDKDFPKESVYR